MKEKIEKYIEYNGHNIMVTPVKSDVMIAVVDDDDGGYHECWFVRRLSIVDKLLGKTKRDLVKEKIEKAKKYIDKDLSEKKRKERKIKEFVKNIELED